MKEVHAPVDWLLEGEPWIEYRTRVDLLGQTESNAQVKSARKGMLASPQVKALVRELAFWPGKVIASHKSAGQPFHKLTFLADLGLTSRDPGVAAIVKRVVRHASAEGPLQLPTNIPTQYGGTGKDTWAWALCDAPLSVYALIKFGEGRQPAVQAAIKHLVGLVRDNGWPCAVSKELGSFRGPGRKDDPCPFANLAMLKALSEVKEYRDGAASKAGAETLLTLWEESRTRHPYMFFMGTDFRKLKVPFVWYDLIHVLEVLSRFPPPRKDARLKSMVQVLKSKADSQGCFTLESIWTAWKDWEFGQKAAPSRWLTLAAWRVINRMENAA
jgi:hypothetical protein